MDEKSQHYRNRWQTSDISSSVTNFVILVTFVISHACKLPATTGEIPPLCEILFPFLCEIQLIFTLQCDFCDFKREMAMEETVKVV